MMEYKLGIDIGSTTLKLVVLDERNKIVYKSYERHFSQVRTLLAKRMGELKKLLEGKPLQVALAGSAALGVSEETGLPFVQEVFAATQAVRALYPKVNTVIELGGEDAKIIFLKGAPEERMNSTCAGGTGSFIDQMAALLGVELDELDALSLKAESIYPIASRCGVFAKTDIQPLINDGARKEDLAASIFQAVVNQTISGLAQGRPIEPPVLFLGGPLSFLKGLGALFCKTLKLKTNEAIFPDTARYFVALGAAIYAGGAGQAMDYGELMGHLDTASRPARRLEGLEPFFASEREYAAFAARHERADAPHGKLEGFCGVGYLGIDAGSTTTKLALIDGEGRILYSHYCRNEGDPLGVVIEQMKKIYATAGKEMRLAGAAVTGYGEQFIGGALRCDAGVVETVAHYTAARYFNPKVSFVIDIGGQDMKCFRIREGAVDDVLLNEACSSGCGSFLETFASSMGYAIGDFAKEGLFASQPVNLGTRCTVFMNSSVKQAQKEGASVADISAGLSISIVKNALYKVIKVHDAAELGDAIVVQGGTFLNDSVLRAFEKELGRDVVRPRIAGLMGAFGAALYARSLGREQSDILTAQELETFTHTAKPLTCQGCANHCRLTVNTFPGGRKYIAGNRCERPVTGEKGGGLPNLFRYKYEKILALAQAPSSGNGPRIGLPLGLNFYETLYFWKPFFESLGCQVLVSGPSARNIYYKGYQTIPSDTVCYPAKLMHGHVQDLIDRGAEVIFYPCMTYNFEEGMGDNCYNCPVVAYYPEVIAGNMNLAGRQFLMPYISLNDRDFFIRRMEEELAAFGFGQKAIAAAADAGYASQRAYREALFARGDAALQKARETGSKVLILAGRPYHIDPLINHGIELLMSSLGFTVVSEDSIRPLEDKARLDVLNQWTYHARMYNAARACCQMEDTALVQLVSFGCGIDAITTDEVKAILSRGNRLYTQLKIDEINNLGAVKIRLRSLLAAMEEREKQKR